MSVMGFLGFGKKKDFVDLGEKYKKQQERMQNLQSDMQEDEAAVQDTVSTGLGFLGNLASSVGASSQESESSDEGYMDMTVGVEEKRRRLAKRLMDMTEKIEELNNQVYHLQQRIEVLEKKSGVGSY